jgi:hypothetical protein
MYDYCQWHMRGGEIRDPRILAMTNVYAFFWNNKEDREKTRKNAGLLLIFFFLHFSLGE